MNDFPEFMKNGANAIPASSQSAGAQSAGAKGWVFEGADGMQMAFWICESAGKSEEHVHGFDEYRDFLNIRARRP